MRFSIRSLLLLTSVVAWFVAWPTSGAIIGPATLCCSFAVSVVTAFGSNPRVKVVFRSSLVIFLAVICLYLSMGPASWFLARCGSPTPAAPSLILNGCGKAYSYLYKPIATNAIFAPEPLRKFSFNYIRWWMPDTVQFQDMEGKGIAWSDNRNWYTLISFRTK